MPVENSRSQEKRLVFWSWEARIPWSSVSLPVPTLDGEIEWMNQAFQATKATVGDSRSLWKR